MKKIFTLLDASDVMTYGGLTLAGVGISMISLPVALVVVGAVLFLLGIFTAIPWGAKKP
jgi:hypothetical protein